MRSRANIQSLQFENLDLHHEILVRHNHPFPYPYCLRQVMWLAAPSGMHCRCCDALVAVDEMAARRRSNDPHARANQRLRQKESARR